MLGATHGAMIPRARAPRLLPGRPHLKIDYGTALSPLRWAAVTLDHLLWQISAETPPQPHEHSYDARHDILRERPTTRGDHMRLSSIRACGFRSLQDVSLDDCGELNVLIGKNNSGKSNLLSAVRAFFDFFQVSGDVVSISPTVHRGTDWHRQSGKRVVTLDAKLSMNEQEISQLKEDIALEAQQLRNALFSSSAECGISVRLTFDGRDRPVGYVSKVSFFTANEEGNEIFAMEEESAAEIALNVRRVSQAREEMEALNVGMGGLREDEFRMAKEVGVSYALRSHRGSLSDSQMRSLNQIIKNASSPEEFTQICRSKVSQLKTEMEAVERAEIENPVKSFSGESTAVPDYVTKLIARIAGLRVHHLSEQRNPIGAVEARKILRLKTSRGQGAVLAGIQSVVSTLLGVQIDAFSSDETSRRGNQSAAELDVDDFLVQVNGSGIREALRLILDYEFEKPHILLVEEPEVHLHPALETALMQYLRSVSEKCQVFLTTHSTNFLDVGSLKNVYMVSKTPETTVRLLNVAEAEEAIPQELGIRLSSLFMYDRLVFVEGPSDEQLLRIFAETLGISFGQASVGFVTTGGARNFTHFATASTLTFLGKRNVRTVFLLDRDERNNQDLDKLRARIDGISELVVLDRRELENYLLDANVLARYLVIRTDGALQPSPEEVQEKIDKACEGLRSVAIERRALKEICAPVIPRREKVITRDAEEDFLTAAKRELDEVLLAVQELRNSVEKTLQLAENDVEARWSDSKIDLIPGDEILKRLFREYGLSFNKRKDSVRIASVMTGAEIPAEMKRIIDGLVV
ncbi:AAA family ATPase [Streptomyces violaceolatus]|uniref:AAA family ATPase n=2 Tax=Streptomyces violaceoruber group TaxID=2867121 RepID=UPI0031E15FEF